MEVIFKILKGFGMMVLSFWIIYTVLIGVVFVLGGRPSILLVLLAIPGLIMLWYVMGDAIA